ncbi:MAG: hypothetical protein GY750_08835 [Lentisphaerae bacterium]|nr:hypothetical protein [Lentisphaerota bacterium]MCP4101516.1 hypothetical protein [Lentisphaerota bacterium]
MLKLLYTFCVILIAGNICAADYSNLTIKWDEEKTASKAKFEGYFSKENISGYKNDVQTPGDTTVAAALINGYKFSWQPTWRYEGAGQVWLPEVCQSSDRSLLALVENSKNGKGVKSSILVLMNLFNSRVINYIVFNGVDIINFCLVPNNNKIIALVKSPPDKYSDIRQYKLVLLSHYDGRKTVASKSFMYKVNTMCVANNGNDLLVAPESESYAMVYDVTKLNVAPVKVKTQREITAVTAYGKGFIIGGKSFISKLVKSGNGWNVKNKYNAPADFCPAEIVPCGNDKKFAAVQQDGPAYYYNGSIFTQIGDRFEGTVAWDSFNKRVMLVEKRNSVIMLYNPDSSSKNVLFTPAKVKPRTRGDVTGLYPAPDGKAIFALDDKGNLMKLTKPCRRWKKQLIFAAQGK